MRRWESMNKVVEILGRFRTSPVFTWERSIRQLSIRDSKTFFYFEERFFWIRKLGSVHEQFENLANPYESRKSSRFLITKSPISLSDGRVEAWLSSRNTTMITESLKYDWRVEGGWWHPLLFTRFSPQSAKGDCLVDWFRNGIMTVGAIWIKLRNDQGTLSWGRYFQHWFPSFLLNYQMLREITLKIPDITIS